MLKNIQTGFSKLSENTRKAFDTTKLEMKIRGYANEADDIFMEIGKTVYESRGDIPKEKRQRIGEMFNDLDSIAHRIKNLEKTITSIKEKDTKEERNIIDVSGSKNYAKLNKKDDDLTIKRTSQGIRILRFCPECQAENSAQAGSCESCGHEFLRNNVK